MTHSYVINDTEIANKFRKYLRLANEIITNGGVIFQLSSAENDFVAVRLFKKKYGQYMEEVA